MCRVLSYTIVVIAVAFVLTGWTTSAAQDRAARAPTTKKSKTVPPPKWDRAVLDVFFSDARQHLGRGEPGGKRLPPAADPGDSGSTDVPTPADGFAWSQLIDAATLEDEVKALVAPLAQHVATPNAFKGGGFNEARRAFSELALLFGVIGRYDGEVRWKDQGLALRDALGKAGLNAKVATDGSFNEAKRRTQELADLVQGNAPQLPLPEADVPWAAVANRQPLMQRIEIAQRDRLKPWTANPVEFAKHADAVRHEAQLVAAIIEILKDPSYEFADDEMYQQHAAELQGHARLIAEAAQANRFADVQASVGRLSQTCDKCHGDFR